MVITRETPGYDELSPEELKTCCTLRMMPTQYIHVKKTMISAVYHRDFFNKRDAQVWFRMDVNKASFIFIFFFFFRCLLNKIDLYSLRLV